MQSYHGRKKARYIYWAVLLTPTPTFAAGEGLYSLFKIQTNATSSEKPSITTQDNELLLYLHCFNIFYCLSWNTYYFMYYMYLIRIML